MIWKRIFFLILFLISASSGNCQHAELININKKTGLGTDFIYQMLVDRYGYLWLATPRGVIKYNGYEAKVFDFSSGLPNEDVWALFEDTKGRIWCSSHSNRIGYIKNDVFKLVVNKDFDELFNPEGVKNYKKGIAFISKGSLFYELNDTLKKIAMDYCFFSLNDKEEILKCDSLGYSKIGNVDGVRKTVFHFAKNDHPQDVDVPWNMFSFYKMRGTYFDDFIVSKAENDVIWVISKGKPRKVSFDIASQIKSKLIDFQDIKGSLLVRFNNLILLLNKEYKISHSYFLDKIGLSGTHIPMVLQQPLWDTLFATNINGLYINRPVKATLASSKIKLNEHQLLGAIGDTSVWWEPNTGNLLLYKNTYLLKTIKITDKTINGFIQINKNTLILFFPNGRTFWVNIETGKQFNVSQFPIMLFPKSIAVNKDKTKALFVGSSGLSYSDLTDKGIAGLKLIDESNKYVKVLYDSFYDCFIFFKYDKVGVFKNGHTMLFDKQELNLLGINNIDDIVTNNTGNWFIKDNKQLHLLNITKNLVQTLPSYVNLSDSKMLFFKNNLIVAGQFGMCFYKVMPNNDFKYTIKINSRSLFYEKIYNLWGGTDGILLNTDKGTYSYRIPEDTLFDVGVKDNTKYTLLTKYDTSVFSTTGSDTIFINQSNKRLILDVINPMGIGKPRYSYSIDNGRTYTSLTNNELYLEDVLPGGYHQLNIAIQDNAWISGKNSFCIYLIPYWWQTNYGKAIIGLCILAILLLVAFVAFIITQRNIKKRNERNQLQMDIELKSIYSQINPHFIFNTLSGTQYFIRENRNQEARLHLNKFSRLLRSYIHSSRNKYISIKDELGNLVNYIELQQIRFVDKFDYELIVAEDLQTDAVKIPSLLLQPIVENAINHGLFHIEGYKGLLRLVFSRNVQTNEVICVVDDNGVGRNRAREIKADSIVKAQSYGDALIRDLINIFNKYEKLNIEIEYIDKVEPLTGTTVTIKIKNPVYESRAN